MAELVELMDSKVGIENFATRVLSKLGLTDWQMEWTKCSGGECIDDMKMFTIPVRMIGMGFQAREYVLHEIAHIFIEGVWHGRKFYEQYTKLLTRFMTDIIEEDGEVD